MTVSLRLAISRRLDLWPHGSKKAYTQMNDYTIADVFDRLCAHEGARIAVRQGNQKITFQDLLSWSQAMSSALEAVIHEPGQRIGLMLPNSAAFVAAFFAVARVGG